MHEAAMPTQPPSIVMHHIRPQLSIDRAGGRRSDAAWIAGLHAHPEARYILLADLKLAVVQSAEKTALRGFTAADLANVRLDLADVFLLGLSEHGAPVFAVALAEHLLSAFASELERFTPFVELRSLALEGRIPPEDLALAGQARALAAWHALQRCCGRCGARTRSREGGWRRDCRACGQVHFPRSDPAVIMAITHQDRLLLGHEYRFPEKLYSVLAGFVEPGDDIETAVRREIMEEAGVPVGAVHYIASQPWPFPHSLMIGCWGEALSDTITLDITELPEARWVSREEVVSMLAGAHPLGHIVPPPLSIAHTLIRAFAEGKLGAQAD
jgi:NAD+ diphosphatase